MWVRRLDRVGEGSCGAGYGGCRDLPDVGRAGRGAVVPPVAPEVLRREDGRGHQGDSLGSCRPHARTLAEWGPGGTGA